MSKLGDIALDSLELPWLGGRERSVLRHMADCQTERLGGNVLSCTCGHREVHYNSCRDRHCPLCQGAARARWVRARLGELLPTPYFHVVFTVPHELLPLALANRRVFYRSLFVCVHETLLAVCATPENLGGRAGGMSILHTWNQKLAFHPHLHCIVPGGGVSPDGTRWIAGNPGYLVSVKRLSAVFRGKLLGSLEKSIERGELRGEEAALRGALRKAAGKAFVVYAKPPFGGPEQVVKYLGRYTHRVGISEKIMCLSHDDFIRKFMLHILPKALRKIRYFGFMANRDRTASIAHVRELIASSIPCPAVHETSLQIPGEVAANTKPEKSIGTTCPKCGSLMSVQRASAWAPGPFRLKSRLTYMREIHGPEPNQVASA